jgi:ComF family protein
MQNDATKSIAMSLAAKALDLLLPPLCLACDAPVTGHGALCAACWSGIHFIAAPLCSGCGAPFDAPVGDGMLCAACLTDPPVFSGARAAMLYDEASKRLILGFKHGDRTHLARALAGWMHRAGREFWGKADCVIPVPLHRWRLFRRRYNQAALLAEGIGALANKPVLIDGLRRPKATPIQGRMNRKQRQANVKGAFALHPRRREEIRDKTIILIDDVLTTGATLNECSRVLLEGGAKSVSALTLARVRGYQ